MGRLPRAASSGWGVVYKLGGTGKVTVLHSFPGGSDASDPRSGVALYSEGNLYGTTLGGGSANSGVVYKLDMEGAETVLHSFTGAPME